MSEFTRAQLRAVTRRAQAAIARSRRLRSDLQEVMATIRDNDASARRSSDKDVAEKKAIRKR
jgi:hypothetical protein